MYLQMRASFYMQREQKKCIENVKQDIQENTRTNWYRQMNKHRQTTLHHHGGWTKHGRILQHQLCPFPPSVNFFAIFFFFANCRFSLPSPPAMSSVITVLTNEPN
jgi:hypothetical protein